MLQILSEDASFLLSKGFITKFYIKLNSLGDGVPSGMSQDGPLIEKSGFSIASLSGKDASGVGWIFAGVYVFKEFFLPDDELIYAEEEQKAADISSRLSLEEAAMEARNSSTCFKDRELCRVSRGQIEGTIEYSSKPKALCFCSKIVLGVRKLLLLSERTSTEPIFLDLGRGDFLCM